MGSTQKLKLPYLPALDGIRGAAVVAVLLFHAGFTWAVGGYLGVTVFFVLSGFLITSLLLLDRGEGGTVDLRSFWARRARRLVPAVLVLVAVVIAVQAISDRRPPLGLLGDGAAALAWVANWRFVFAHRSYAALFSAPSPFQHTWSLAVEEQFYLFLPLLFVAALGLRGRRRSRWRMAVPVTLLVIASTIVAAWLYAPGGAAEGRAYYGTDARAAEPLLGVLLALLITAPGGLRRLGAAWRWVLDVSAAVAVGGLVLLVAHLGERSPSLYRGGFLLAAALAAIVIAAATQPGSLVGRVLAAPPLVGLGKISYGVYLYHWPIFLWLTPRRTQLSTVPLLGVRVAATLVLAIASYVLIERPVRFGKLLPTVGLVGWADLSVGLLAGLAVITTTPTVQAPSYLASGPTAPVVTVPPPPPVAAAISKAAPVAKAAPAATAPTTTPTTTKRVSRGGGTTIMDTSHQLDAAPVPPPKIGPDGKPALKVLVVGDSMAGGLAVGLESWADGRTDVQAYTLDMLACPLSRGGTRRLADGSYWAVKPDCAWWDDTSSDRYKKFQQYDPDIVVMQDGMNVVPDRKLPSWSDWRSPGQPQFDSWLLNEYIAASKVFTAGGAKLLALNAVCADWEELGGPFTDYANNKAGDTRVAALDRAVQGLASAGVQVVDYQSHLCPGGKFTDTVDGVSDARPDGYHLSVDASDAVAERWLGPIVLKAKSSGSVIAP